MICDRVRLDLVAYHAGDLDPAESAGVDAHLATCAACRVELEELVETLSLVERNVPRVAPPPNMKEGALARVEAERLGGLLALADVPEPPPGLKAEALRRATRGAAPVVRVVDFRKRAGAAALGVAAVAALLTVTSLWTRLGDVTAERDRAVAIAGRAEQQAGPAGHPVQELTLAAEGVSAGVDLYHFRHDNYRIVLD
ncbi:MAG: zf-HC2 domain-containing protein, partial [Actinomycetota bacterium]|nr:zf-HC2 domain-containing protein [Actinomycetota bacterium]